MTMSELCRRGALEDLRRQYELAVHRLREKAFEMRRHGASPEIIARMLHEKRRRIAGIFKEMTPDPLKSQIYERTLRVYGNVLGPAIDLLRAE